MCSFEKIQDENTLAHLTVMRKGLMCGICDGFLRDAYNLPCGHNFCQHCVNQALAHHTICPMCKIPAWQRDILKVAIADSAVSEWVSHCEAKYQILIARAAEDGDEMDSMQSDNSSQSELDDVDLDSPVAQPAASVAQASDGERHENESPVQISSRSSDSVWTECLKSRDSNNNRLLDSPLGKLHPTVPTKEGEENAQCPLSLGAAPGSSSKPGVDDDPSIFQYNKENATSLRCKGFGSFKSHEDARHKVAACERVTPRKPFQGNNALPMWVSPSFAFTRDHIPTRKQEHVQDGSTTDVTLASGSAAKSSSQLAERDEDEGQGMGSGPVMGMEQDDNGSVNIAAPPVGTPPRGGCPELLLSSPPNDAKRRHKEGMSLTLFGEQLPDTCDVVGADSFSCSAAHRGGLIRTPPELDGARTGIELLNPGGLDLLAAAADGSSSLLASSGLKSESCRSKLRDKGSPASSTENYAACNKNRLAAMERPVAARGEAGRQASEGSLHESSDKQGHSRGDFSDETPVAWLDRDSSRSGQEFGDGAETGAVCSAGDCNSASGSTDVEELAVGKDGGSVDENTNDREDSSGDLQSDSLANDMECTQESSTLSPPLVITSNDGKQPEVAKSPNSRPLLAAESSASKMGSPTVGNSRRLDEEDTVLPEDNGSDEDTQEETLLGDYSNNSTIGPPTQLVVEAEQAFGCQGGSPARRGEPRFAAVDVAPLLSPYPPQESEASRQVHATSLPERTTPVANVYDLLQVAPPAENLPQHGNGGAGETLPMEPCTADEEERSGASPMAIRSDCGEGRVISKSVGGTWMQRERGGEVKNEPDDETSSLCRESRRLECIVEKEQGVSQSTAEGVGAPCAERVSSHVVLYTADPSSRDADEAVLSTPNEMDHQLDVEPTPSVVHEKIESSVQSPRGVPCDEELGEPCATSKEVRCEDGSSQSELEGAGGLSATPAQSIIPETLSLQSTIAPDTAEMEMETTSPGALSKNRAMEEVLVPETMVVESVIPETLNVESAVVGTIAALAWSAGRSKAGEEEANSTRNPQPEEIQGLPRTDDNAGRAQGTTSDNACNPKRKSGVEGSESTESSIASTCIPEPEERVVKARSSRDPLCLSSQGIGLVPVAAADSPGREQHREDGDVLPSLHVPETAVQSLMSQEVAETAEAWGSGDADAKAPSLGDTSRAHDGAADDGLESEVPETEHPESDSLLKMNSSQCIIGAGGRDGNESGASSTSLPSTSTTGNKRPAHGGTLSPNRRFSSASARSEPGNEGKRLRITQVGHEGIPAELRPADHTGEATVEETEASISDTVSITTGGLRFLGSCRGAANVSHHQSPSVGLDDGSLDTTNFPSIAEENVAKPCDDGRGQHGNSDEGGCTDCLMKVDEKSQKDGDQVPEKRVDPSESPPGSAKEANASPGLMPGSPYRDRSTSGMDDIGVNPYHKESCLQLNSDNSKKSKEQTLDDALELVKGKELGPGGSVVAEGTEAGSKDLPPPKSKRVLRRPSAETMGFGAPNRAGAGASRGPCALGSAAVDTRRREQRGWASSNKILAAGRGVLEGGNGGSLGDSGDASLMRHGVDSVPSSEDTVSSSKVPNTQDIDAYFPSQTPEGSSSDGPSMKDMKRAKTSAPDWIARSSKKFGADVGDTGVGGSGGNSRSNGSNGASHSRGGTSKNSGEQTRPKKRALGSVQGINEWLEKKSGSNRGGGGGGGDGNGGGGGGGGGGSCGGGSRDKRRGNGDVKVKPRLVLALLGCDDWEVERAKLLCRELGQRRLYTQLVQGVTHVVVGSRHTLEDEHDVDSKRRKRHRLVKHGIKGYLEAVLLGLWVLDFSWVEASLAKLSNGDRGHCPHVDSNELAMTRQFEMAGCMKRHDGCDAYKGRLRRKAVSSGNLAQNRADDADLFRGYLFYLVAGAKRQSLQEENRLAILLELAGAKISRNMQNGARKAGRGSSDDGSILGKRSSITEVIVAVADDGNEDISRETARAALERMEDIPEASAAVNQSWVLRSIEDGKALPFEDHSVVAQSPKKASNDLLSLVPSRHHVTDPVDAMLLESRQLSHAAVQGTKRLASRDDDLITDSNWVIGGPGLESSSTRRGSSSRLDIRDKRSRNGGGSREVVLDTENGSRARDREHSTACGSGPASWDAKEVMDEALEILENYEKGDMKRAQREAEVAEVAKSVSRARSSPKGFEFTRVGESKEVNDDVETRRPDFWDKDYAKDLEEGAGVKPDTNAKDGPSAMEIYKVGVTLRHALHTAGYLDEKKEQWLADFWFNLVYNGMVARSAERYEQFVAADRGCPATILRRVFEETKIALTETTEGRLRKLERGEMEVGELEFALWEAEGSSAGKELEVTARRAKGGGAGDALEVS